MDNYEIDKDAIIKQMKEMLNKQFNMQTRYFQLLTKLNDSTKQMSAISENIMKLPMSDQVLYLEAAAKTADVAIKLCDKYDLCEEDEE